MKVYSISKWAFFGICILILALPVSQHWRLLVTGEKETGMVTELTIIARENIAGEKIIEYVSEVQFSVQGTTHIVYGPSNYEYKNGRSIGVMYNPADPSDYCLLTFTGFYLNNYMILPLVLLILWAAFYLSFNSYIKRKRGIKQGDNTLI